jgi:hypothetical protein
MIYRFIREHTDEFRVETMCRVLKVSRTADYCSLIRPISQRRVQDKVIKEQILQIYRKSRRVYGSPRIHRKLDKQGIHCGKKRVERLMKEAGIRSIQKRKFKVTTDSKHDLPVAENILNRNFNADSANTKWTSDITYIRTQRRLAVPGGDHGPLLQKNSRLFDAEIPEPGVGHRSPEHGNQEPSPRPGTDHPLRPRLPVCKLRFSATTLAAWHHLFYESQG